MIKLNTRARQNRAKAKRTSFSSSSSLPFHGSSMGEDEALASSTTRALAMGEDEALAS